MRRYQAPLAEWARSRIRTGRATVVGVNGPQGAGKSTLVAAWVAAFETLGVHAVALSIDDFYRPARDLDSLASRFPADPTLAQRGYPGTHDVELGCEVLAALRDGAAVSLPVYDKGAAGGRGDRVPEVRWPRRTGPWDLVFLEGWMLGYAPVADPPVALRAANEALAAYRRWTVELDALVMLHTRRLDTIVAWRVDAERSRRERGEGGMTDAAARDYILRFLPAYQTWWPPFLAEPPVPDWARVELGPDRRPTGPIRYATPPP